MKSLKIFSVLCLAVMMVMGVGSAAHAAKSLEVGTDNVLNTGDESARTADLYITLKGGFNDVNGLAFTLIYDKDVFDFVGLAADTISLYDGDTYDPDNPPDEAAIASSSIVYMANNKPDEGLVLIAAAGANFLATDTSNVVPFKAQFRVVPGMGNGLYPINVQQTIIGPDTAQSAGYDVLTPIPIAAGLDPEADPTTATSYPVTFIAGSITVGGGYAISGTVQYDGGINANGAVVRLFRKVGDDYFLNDSTTVSNGQFAFNAKPNGTYKLVVLSTNPGFQRRYESGEITVAGAAYDAGTITLAAYTPLSGTILLNGSAVPGVKAKVMDGATLIGYFPVDANGNFVTAPLDPNKVYTITAVYGNEETPYDPVDGVFNWTLGLGTLSGTISGLTIGQNVMIHIVSADAQLEKVLFKTAASDVDYQFENLLPATDYIVSVVGDGIQVSYYDGVTDAGVPDINDAAPQTVTAGLDTPDIDFVFPSVTTTIEGQISEGGTGVTGVPVFALTTTFAMYSGLSVEGGAYSLLVEDGTYIVFAYKNNGKTFYYNSTGTTQVDTGAELVVVSGSSVDGKDISLDEQNGVITGQVTYRRLGGDPVAGIMVRADGPKGSAIDVTDESGNYTLSGLYTDLDNKEHDVTIYPDNPYPPQTESVVASPDGTDQNFVIHTGWVLSGTVTKDGESSTKISGAWVYLVNSSGVIQGIPAFTDIDGIFTLADIPSGIYTLSAEHPDYYQPEPVGLDIQTDISGYALTMAQGVSITGIVSDADGPLGNVRITATVVGDVAHYVFTNNVGVYEINGLVESTTYFLMVSKEGYLRQFVSTMAAQAGFNFELQVLPIGYNFGGTVQETGGGAIDGAIVVVSSASKNFGDSTITAGDGGRFDFTDLVESTDYKIVVIPGGNRPVYIEEHYDLNANVPNYVIDIPVGAITGTVTLSDSATGADVTVYLIDANGDYVTDVTAADQGGGNYGYTFDGIEALTDFKVVAFTSGYGMGWHNGTTFADADTVQSGDEDIDIDLTLQ